MAERTWRGRLLVILALLPLYSAMALSNEPKTYELRIESGPLAQALQDFAKQSGIQVIFFSKVTDGHRAPALNGSFTAEAALHRLLQDANLTYREINASTVEIRPIASVNSLTAAPPTAEALIGAANVPSQSDQQERKSSSDSFRLAQATPGATSPSASAGTPGLAPGYTAQLNEIVVTAQKREERLSDVPLSVTAVSAEELVADNQLRLQDYYSSIPGLNVTPQASLSSQLISIRGITTGVNSNPSVGVVIDDVPYGPSSLLGGGGSLPVPDIDPNDLSRVEVLRGPQGTIYGASSLGGLLKFVTKDPSTQSFEGRVLAGTENIEEAHSLGYTVRASINVPLSDTWALRASAFGRQDPGYIDNVQTGLRDVNTQDVYGAHLAALWHPSDAMSLKLSALLQDFKGDGFNDVDRPVNGYTGPPLGPWDQSYLRGTGAYERKVQAYSATWTDKMGGAELTSITGYNVSQFSDAYDLTPAYAASTLAQFGVPGTAGPEHNRTNKVTQELRLSTPLGHWFDWLIGGFFAHESSAYSQNVVAVNATNGAYVGIADEYSAPASYQEFAAFTDLTIHFTDQWDLQVGGRESHVRQTFTYTYLATSAPPAFVLPEVDTSSKAFTYLFTPRYKLLADLMIYARLASGFRPGGPNAGVGVPPSYAPDKTEDFELGAKGEFLDRTLSIDLSLYRINWKDIQIFVFQPVTYAGYTGNGSEAKSQGIELSMESRPRAGLTLSGWVTWDDASLTQPFPPSSSAVGATGDALPYTSRFSANVALDQSMALGANQQLSLGGALAYIGDRKGEFESVFASTPLRQDLPAYAKLDLHAVFKSGPWTVTAYANNVTNRGALLAGGLGTYPAFAFVYIQPRTVGLNIARSY